MIVLNFSHPLTEEQIAQIEALTGQAVERVIVVPVQFDAQQPFIEQFHTLVSGIPLDAGDWQSTPLLVNLPSLNHIAALVLAELHGRMGHFPAVLRLRPVVNALPPRFEVAEILNLQAVRDQARKER